MLVPPRALGAALAVLWLAAPGAHAQPAAKATFATPPTATIAHWRNNATAAYSILHDDACDGFKGPPARGTYGLFDYWPEAAQRGLRIGMGPTARECTETADMLVFLRGMRDAGYEIYAHSWFHCDHTQEPSACMVWSDAANGGAGGEVPLTTLVPEIDTRQKLIDYEMQQSKAWLSDPANAGAAVGFYSFPYDLFDSLALSRLATAGYLGARGGDRATGNVNRWHINPDPAAGGDASIDYRVLFDEYNANDTLGNPANTSDYDPPSITTYLDDVVNGGLGGWGVQVLHGIADLSFGTVALDVYRNHLDAVAALQDQRKLWVATPTEAIRYRRTNYHCGNSRGGADAVVGVDTDGNLSFAGLGDPKCPLYATEVTLVVTLPAGLATVTATQNGNPLAVRAAQAAGKVLIDANPVLGTINLQPVASPQAPAITSASSATFAVGAAGAFTFTATGNPAPTFALGGTPPPGLALNTATGVVSGTPTIAGSFARTLSAVNGLAPDATQAFTFVVNKGSQTINFAAVPGLNVTEVESVAATATSGLPVTFGSSTPGVCSVSNQDRTVTGLAIGVCTLQATQLGDANWNAAPTATQSFNVMGTQSISFGPAPSIVVGGTGNASATATSGLTVTFTAFDPDVCTVVGNVVTGQAAGDCTIAANQAGNAFYHPASQVTQTFPIVKSSQTIVFGAAPVVVVGGVGNLSASASSGLAVTFTSNTPSTCAVSGSVVSGLAQGSCTVAASQSGNGAYNPAPTVTQTFSIGANAGTFGLTVARVGDGQGTVFSTPSGIDCGATCGANFGFGASVMLTASPAPGSTFIGWSGACAGKGVCNVTMDAAKSVWATFTLYTSLPRLANISTRGRVMSGDSVMIGGFVIGGSTPKTVVVRAIGPSLANYGIANPLSNPRLDLYSGQTVIASNDDWQADAAASAVAAAGFAPPDTHESAILVTLAPGGYTAIVSGVGGATGTGMVEVFELDPAQGPLDNISTRAQVLTGDDVLIGGFIIQGDEAKSVVIRALGPSLAAFGVPGALSNPRLQLFSGSTLIAEADASSAYVQQLGFAPADRREAAMFVTLAPGAYTAIVSSADGVTGIGMVEVFALTPPLPAPNP